MPEKTPSLIEAALILDADVIFDMTAPIFEDIENEWITEMDQSAIPADGTVLYLNQLLLDDQNSVLIKSSSEDNVHLIVENPLISTDVINVVADIGGDIGTVHHYYEFPNDLKVYSEHSLQLILLEG